MADSQCMVAELQQFQKMDKLQYLIRMVFVSSVKMSVQEFHEALITALQINEAGDIVYNIKCVCPLITLRPTFIFSGPCATGVPSFHEPRGIVEYRFIRR